MPHRHRPPAACHPRSFRPGRLQRRFIALTVAVALVLPLPLARPARALYIPPCEAIECPLASVWWSIHLLQVMSALGAFEAGIAVSINELVDRLGKLANNESQNVNEENRTDMTALDKENAAATEASLAQIRAKAMIDRTPAPATCVALSDMMHRARAEQAARGQIRAAETRFGGVFSNAPGSISENGRIAFLSERFELRTQRYCDPTMGLPASIPCTATVGPNRDLQPNASIFMVENLANANDYTAAQDVVYNLMGDAVADPVGGPGLARQPGQAIAVLRLSEQARQSLASATLMAMVERRRDASGNGQSELSVNSRMSFAGSSARSLLEATSGQVKAQNIGTIATMLRQSSVQLFALRGLLEQWAALRAASLAMDVKASSAPATAVSSRVLNIQ